MHAVTHSNSEASRRQSLRKFNLVNLSELTAHGELHVLGLVMHSRTPKNVAALLAVTMQVQTCVLAVSAGSWCLGWITSTLT